MDHQQNVRSVAGKCVATGTAAMKITAVAALMLLAAECAVSQTTGTASQQTQPVENLPQAAATMDSPTWSTDGQSANTQKPSAAIPRTAAPAASAPAQNPTTQNAASTTDPAAYGWPTNANGTAQPGNSVAASGDPDSQIVTTPVSDAAATPVSNSAAPQLQTRYNSADPDADIVTSVISGPNELPEGTLVQTRLSQEITSSSNFTGMDFTARVTDSIMKDGGVVVPANSIVHGRIVYANSASLMHGGARIMLRPDEIITPDGTHYVLHAVVVRTDAFTSSKPVGEGEIADSPSKWRTGTTFAAITGGGAGAGLLLGGPVGMAAGATVGAAVGTAHWALHSRSVDLPENSIIVFSLSEPMSIHGLHSYSGLTGTPPPAAAPVAQSPVQPAVATTPY